MKATLATSANSLLLATLAACSAAPATATSLDTGQAANADTEPGEVGASPAPPESTGPPASTGTGAPGTSTSDPDTGESASSGAVPDLGAAPDLGIPLPAGCYGKKIDFVFVISNSIGMEDMQERLLAAFPGFMEAIESRHIDKHILVTTALPMWIMSDCADCQWDCDEHADPPECDATLNKCDTTLGAGYTFPAGKGASNRRCELAGGNRYITDEEEDLDAAFQCLATVGLDGSDAYQAGAMLGAISPELNAPGACNAGFLREDALLVITIIANTGDTGTLLYPEEWVEDLLAAKHGDGDAIYLLVIQPDLDTPGHICDPDSPYLRSKGRLRILTEMLPHASLESICADDYVPFFTDALETVQELCDSFVPPP